MTPDPITNSVWAKYHRRNRITSIIYGVMVFCAAGIIEMGVPGAVKSISLASEVHNDLP